MAAVSRAYIALGSNLGDRHAIVSQALTRLAEHGRVVATSSFYETEPHGQLDQPTFINAACVLDTEETPERLLIAMHGIERTFGRDRSRESRWGPRALDLDLLLYDDLVERSETLTLPHPRLHERPFVLVPLAEIAATALHPTLRKTIGQLAEEIGSAGVRQLRTVRGVPSVD
jgi:2-amino-4-hydroxy-6-hydroxymethyldihydropteridine diphosphokinase